MSIARRNAIRLKRGHTVDHTYLAYFDSTKERKVIYYDFTQSFINRHYPA